MKKFITKIKSCLKGATIKSSITVCMFLIALSLSSFAQITRTQIMNTAYSYSDASYSWTANSSNLDWGISCGGKIIHYASPSYGGCVINGTNWGMPYCWGGWSTISQHNSAMTSGLSAGDICPTGYGWCPSGGAGLSCASGMDCSGFVSRDWQLSSKYNCSGLNGISTPTSASLVQQGDIYNNTSSTVNHVRLVSSYSSGTGNTTIVEASGRDWRTSYYTYTPSQLSGYTPRVYNVFVCNAPTSPYVYSITASQATFNWTSSGGVSYNYYLKTSASSTWTLFSGYTYKPVTISGLAAGTTYNFKVSQNCSGGTSATSSIVTFTTPTMFAASGSRGTLTVSDGNTTTGISEEENAITQVSIFPNPVKAGQEISVEGLPDKTILTIYSLEGKLVTAMTAQGSSIKMNLPADLPPAIYIANLKTTNGFTENKRLVVTQ